MMGLFLLHLILTAVWLLLTEDVGALNLLLGIFIAWVAVVMYAHATGDRHYTRMLRRVVAFAVYFIFILFKANWQVAREVISPDHGMKPRLLRYDVSGLTHVQVTTLANAITLTPGTLSADIDETGQTLLIHCMYAENREDAIAELDELRDRLMKGVFGQ